MNFLRIFFVNYVYLENMNLYVINRQDYDIEIII
jgi:hypothetical protein